jgi:hypothetical protein
MTDFRMTGGCQCGAVRYALHAEPSDPMICHCRMCQKQFGSFFGAFAAIDRKDFEITRGALARFQSSDIGARTFCADCGTPLGYDPMNRRSNLRIWISIGSLDDAAAVKPLKAWGGEARLRWVGEVVELVPGLTGGGDTDPSFRDAERIHPRTHPDHDTAVWPPEGRAHG